MQEKAKKLYELRTKINEIKDTLLAPLEEEREMMQGELLEELQKENQFSVRYDFATITRAVRKTAKVIDEEKVIAYLKDKGLENEYVSPRLNKYFDTLSKQMVKTGDLADGMEIKESEYISIRESGKEEKRKVTIQ
jgi:phosphoglycerate-specific signal transduction histidine kinase